MRLLLCWCGLLCEAAVINLERRSRECWAAQAGQLWDTRPHLRQSLDIALISASQLKKFELDRNSNTTVSCYPPPPPGSFIRVCIVQVFRHLRRFNQYSHSNDKVLTYWSPGLHSGLAKTLVKKKRASGLFLDFYWVFVFFWFFKKGIRVFFINYFFCSFL